MKHSQLAKNNFFHISKLNWWLLIALNLFVLAACADQANNTQTENPQTSESVDFAVPTYQVKQINESRDDANSPMGYWEINISYPVFDNPKNDRKLQAINQAIEELAITEYCEDSGDKTFSANLAFVTPGIATLTYESMWMCATMPRPDWNSGSIIIDFNLGGFLTLNQYTSAEAEQALVKLIDQKVQAEQALRNPAECNDIPIFNQAYPSADQVMFIYSSDGVSNLECDYQISLPVATVKKYFASEQIFIPKAMVAD